MSEQVVAQAMREYGQAVRGDWSDLDGRAVRAQMDQFADAITGGRGGDWSLERWREDLGVCLTGKGHWSGRWGYCDEACSPTTEGAGA